MGNFQEKYSDPKDWLGLPGPGHCATKTLVHLSTMAVGSLSSPAHTQAGTDHLE